MPAAPPTRMAERDLIAAIQSRLPGSGGAPTGDIPPQSLRPETAGTTVGPAAAGLLQGIGDDCAIWRPAPGTVSLVTTDTLVEGVHFDRAWHPPRLLGRKAVAVNLSDIAAMGGTPRYLLLSLSLSGNEEAAWREQLLDGLVEAATAAGVALIGGDTVRSPAGAMLSLTVIGEAPPEQVCRRSGGRAGDSVWVGGPLGLAAAGLALCRQGRAGEEQWREAVAAHLDPQAQVALGRKLAASGLVHAMLDLSDGLATDLAHLCTASGPGAEISEALLPIPAVVRQAAAQCQADPLTWAIAGGEDYRLLFTCAPANDQAVIELGRELERELERELGRQLGAEQTAAWERKSSRDQEGRKPGAPLPTPALTRIGRLTERPGVIIKTAAGRSREIGYQGYDHFPVTMAEKPDITRHPIAADLPAAGRPFLSAAEYSGTSPTGRRPACDERKPSDGESPTFQPTP